MINPSMTDEQNKTMFLQKRYMCQAYMDDLELIWTLKGCDSCQEDDMKLYIANSFYNYYTQVLNEDYGCNFSYIQMIYDAAWEKEFKKILNKLEGEEDAK